MSERDELGYATRLAESLWRQYYKADAPDWQPLDTVAGVLTQIDNMVSGMARATPTQAVPALTEPVAQDECAQDVYERGQSIGLFDIPKETANAICAGIAAITGARVDWHYVGGRVHMKALAAPKPSPEPRRYQD